MDYLASLDTTTAATAGSKEIGRTLGVKRGKRVPGCTEGGSGTSRFFYRVRRAWFDLFPLDPLSDMTGQLD